MKKLRNYWIVIKKQLLEDCHISFVKVDIKLRNEILLKFLLSCLTVFFPASGARNSSSARCRDVCKSLLLGGLSEYLADFDRQPCTSNPLQKNRSNWKPQNTCPESEILPRMTPTHFLLHRINCLQQ